MKSPKLFHIKQASSYDLNCGAKVMAGKSVQSIKDLRGLSDAFQALAHDGQGVFGGEEQHRHQDRALMNRMNSTLNETGEEGAGR